MRFYLSIILACLLLADNVRSWRIFWKGRHRNGNLGDPSSATQSLKTTSDLWFIQNLDHNDPTNNATWKQRYYVNNEYYKPGGPVFLMIGGEGEATDKWMHQGAWIRYAAELNALCFQLEHRFYGKSHPTPDLSTENLIYLSSEQALADLAFFIEEMNLKYNLQANSKWIAFGGSYPGSLAAWMREKYPHLVHGAISTSGPLLAKADFREYYDVVVSSLGTYSDKCVESVRQSFAQTEILLKHMIGQRSIDEKFKTCDPIEKSIDNQLDMANFFENLASVFAGIVQYNKDNRRNTNVTIDTICDIMVNTTIGPPVNRLAVVSNLVLEMEGEKCLDYKYEKMINEIKNISWDSSASSGSRQWTYQTCTEFGFYQTSDNASLVFGDRFPINFFVRQCSDIYGLKYNNDSLGRGIYKTNTIYGGLHPVTTNVLYVHGSIDPWHALGLIETIDPELPTIYIEGTAHCANMYEPSDTDLPQLTQAREMIRAYLTKFIK